MIKVKNYKKMGRGLYSTKSIKKGTTFMTCETILLNKQDSKLVDKTLLASYVYDAGSGQSCLALGLGSLYNHSSSENVEFNIVKFSGRVMIKYKALRDIKAGTQLFLNYGYEP
jgi:SET domain-containing protein